MIDGDFLIESFIVSRNVKFFFLKLDFQLTFYLITKKRTQAVLEKKKKNYKTTSRGMSSYLSCYFKVYIVIKVMTGFIDDLQLFYQYSSSYTQGVSISSFHNIPIKHYRNMWK